MKKLYVYMILHGNLSFSCIPTSQYSVVLDNCFWPVLEMVKKGFKLGLEFPGQTLEEIEKIDSSFIKELKNLWDEGKCDFIGSSYTQSVFPLIPCDLNKKNISFGKEIYEKYFGRCPEIAFVNEQTFSPTLPSLYIDEGYKALVMDWDNAAEFNHYPDELRYNTAFVASNNKKISLLWNSSLNSYKFQRCIYDRLPIDEFLSSVTSHSSMEKDRALILYGTDWEMFDYRPMTGETVQGEINKIQLILTKLKNIPSVELVRPTEVLNKIPPKEEILISSPECPLPCKNRDDYNIIRWAVSGRDDVQINTQCYRFYNDIKTLEGLGASSDEIIELWKDLCALWGSDYRTKTTNEKHYYFKNNMGEKLSLAISLKEKKISAVIPKEDLVIVNTIGIDLVREPIELSLQFEKGKYKKAEIGLLANGKELICQCEEFEYYRDGSIRKVKMITELTLDQQEKISCSCFPKDKQNSSEGLVRIDKNFINIDTPEVYISLCNSTGADIRELVFKNIHPDPLIKYLPPVYFDHIGHSNDYFSGWNQYCNNDGTVFNDTIGVTQTFGKVDHPIRIPVYFSMDLPFGKCWKTVYTYTHVPRVDIKFRFTFFDLNPVYFRAAITTFNPEAFDKGTLSFATVNGTELVERFFLNGRRVMHNKPVVPKASGTTCLGATEGWVDISDEKKALSIISDKSSLYNVPMVEYEEISSKYLLRLYNSLSESDETGKVLWRGQDEITFTYLSHRNDISKVRKTAKYINQKLLVVKNKTYL